MSRKSIFLSICSSFWMNFFSSSRTSFFSALISRSASCFRAKASSLLCRTASFLICSASAKAFSISLRPCASKFSVRSSRNFLRTRKPMATPLHTPSTIANSICTVTETTSCRIYLKNTHNSLWGICRDHAKKVWKKYCTLYGQVCAKAAIPYLCREGDQEETTTERNGASGNALVLRQLLKRLFFLQISIWYLPNQRRIFCRMMPTSDLKHTSMYPFPFWEKTGTHYRSRILLMGRALIAILSTRRPSPHTII